MEAKEQEAQSQIASNNLQEKQGLLFPITLELGSKCNKGGIMAMRARVKSPRLAHSNGLPWRGISLEDVLFPRCAPGAEGS